MSISLLAIPLLASAPIEAAPLPLPAPEQSADVNSVQEDGVPAPATEGPPEQLAPSKTSDVLQSRSERPAEAAFAVPPDSDEIVVSARAPSPSDPAEELNVASYQAVQAVDEAVVGPVARGYRSGIPEPVRDGVRNVLNNLDEPIVFLNFLLQFKFGKAAETLGRFAINSTLGMAGLFDVAKKKPFHLPRRSNGLAGTLGYYGVGPGPYLYLPVIGSTTVRDLLARPFDLLILPVAVPRPFADPGVALGKGTISALDERARNDEKIERVNSAADRYLVQREEYLARRKAEIEVLQGKRKNIYEPLYYELPGLPPEDEDGQDAPPEPGARADTAAATGEESVPVGVAPMETQP